MLIIIKRFCEESWEKLSRFDYKGSVCFNELRALVHESHLNFYTIVKTNMNKLSPVGAPPFITRLSLEKKINVAELDLM